MLLIRLIAAATLLLALTGCKEFNGPVWSPDGKRIAFTSYTRLPSGTHDTDLYVLDADDDASQPELLAKGASYPHWLPDGSSLIFAGERDQQGFYTKIMRCKLGVKPEPAAVLSNLRLTHLELSVDGTLGLLSLGKDAKPGAPVTVELWNVADGKRTSLQQLGEIYSPAMTPSGKAMAYAQKIGNHALVSVVELNGTDPKNVFPTEEFNEPNAGSFIIHALPDNDRFLFYAPGGTNVWTVRRDGGALRKYPLPDAFSSPVMVSISEDASTATLTLTQAAGGKLNYHVFNLDLASKKLARLDGDSNQLLGGHMLDPRAARRKGPVRYAWLSAGGLAVGEPGKARYNPLNGEQCIAAANYLIKQNQAEKAVQLALQARDMNPPPQDLGQADLAESKAYLADKKYARAAEAMERSILFYPVKADGLRYLFGPKSGLPRVSSHEFAAQMRDLDELIKNVPDNRILPLLKQAFTERLAGNQRQAQQVYKQIVPMCPRDSHIGGVRFLEAMTAFEDGDLSTAAEKWELAARAADFPHAGYAAGLSAIAYWLDGRAEMGNKANSMVTLGGNKNAALKDELGQLANHVRGRRFREQSQGKPVETGGVKTWVEAERVLLPFAQLTPVRVEDKDGKFSARRLGVRPVTASSVWIGGQQEPIFRVPSALSDPVFSENKQMLAFRVAGEIFPLPDTFCDVLVIDAKGTLLLGDFAGATTGRFQSRFHVKSIAWTGPQEVTATGAEVNVLGAESPAAKALDVPLPQPVAPRTAQVPKPATPAQPVAPVPPAAK